MSYPRSKKEQLKDQLTKLDLNEHRQVIELVKKYTDQLTKTPNGFLVSSDVLPDVCFTEIENYVHFCLDQKKRMETDLQTRKNQERLLQN